LAACCDWPVLLSANARRLRQELHVRTPACVLFWIEARQQVAPTVKLVTWLREFQPRPYRIAVAHRVGEDAETLFRTAGVHGFLHTSADIAAVVHEALWPLLRSAGLFVDTKVVSSARGTSLGTAPSSVNTQPELARPP
jgi:hypothetical protein